MNNDLYDVMQNLKELKGTDATQDVKYLGTILVDEETKTR